MMKLYRKPIPIYKFGDNLKESDSLERRAFIRKSRSIVGLPLFEMKGLMAVWKDVQTKIVCYSEHDNRSMIRDEEN